MSKKVGALVIIVLLSVASFAMTTTIASSESDSSQYNTLDETKDFLSQVLGLDLAKYSLTDSPYLRNDNSTVTPRITVLNESIINPDTPIGLNIVPSVYYFTSNLGMIEASSIFYGRQLAVLNIQPVGDASAYIYAEATGTDLAEKASILLTRYAEYLSQKSGSDTSFLTEMKNVLSSLNTESSNVNITVENINFQVSKKEEVTKFQWIYVDYGIIMNPKRVEIEFKYGDLTSFQDRWSLYKVDGPNVLSAEQAKEIALDAAQKVPLVLGNAKGEIVTLEVPDLSNAPCEIEFFMSPCYGSDYNANNKFSLDPLTLYPLWKLRFHFNETIAGTEGIEVGILGDTRSVFYADSFGYLGDSPTVPSNQALEQQQTESDFRFDLVLAVVVTFVAILLAVLVYWKKRKRQIE